MVWVIMTKDELKAMGQEIKLLPIGERKAAGLRFQAFKRAMEEKTGTEVVPTPKNSRGEELWSLARGPLGYGMTMFETELHIGTADRLTVVVTYESGALKMRIKK